MIKPDYAEQKELKKKRNYTAEAWTATAYGLSILVAVLFILELTK